MHRAYQLHLDQLRAHDRQHRDTSLSFETLQAINPDLSCKVCYPGTNYHRQFRAFWNWYSRTYQAVTYTQRTVTAHYNLINHPTYFEARAATRDIVFSCRYRAPLENSRTVIETLLVSYSRFTLASTLPDEFTANQFDYYLEQLTASSSQPSIPPQTSEETTTTFGSPILGEYQKPFEQFTFNSPTEEFASSQLYPSLEQIETHEATSTLTLTPYREETTPIQFSQRTEHPSSPALPFYQTRPSTLTENPLGPPEPQQPILPSTELSESPGLISKFIRHFTTTTPVTPKENITSPIPGQFPTTTTSSSNLYPQIPSPQT